MRWRRVKFGRKWMVLGTTCVVACCCDAGRVGDGESVVLTAETTEVVIAPDAPKTVRFAADEMTNFLARILGGNIPLSTRFTPGRVPVVLGSNDWSRAAGLSTDGFARDEFVIRVGDGRVYVLGRDDPKKDTRLAIESPHTGVWDQLHEHATGMGVYDFLEHYAQARFYFPGDLGTILPRAEKLVLPAGERRVRPDYAARNFSAFYDGLWYEGTNRAMVLLPARKLNYTRLRMQTQYVPCCHGSNGFRFLQRFAESHPEYFCLFKKGDALVRDVDPAEKRHHPGQLCHSSGAWDVMFEDICSYMRGEGPEVRGMGSWKGKGHKPDWAITTFRRPWVDVMPQDGFVPCQCERCQAAYDKTERHYASELIWSNTVKLANRLKTAGVACRVTQMAYTPYRRVPRGVDIPDNVDVMVAEGGPWSVTDSHSLSNQYAEIRAWYEKLGGRKVWVWTYPNKWGQMAIPDVPCPAPRAWGAYYKHVAPWIFGVFAESECDRAFYNLLNYYVLSRVCWDVTTDVEAVLAEFYAKMFGKAAAPMDAFMRRLEDKWVKEVAGHLVETDLGPMRQPPSEYELWTCVYSSAVIRELDNLLVEAARLAGTGTIEAERVALFRREMYEPLAKHGRGYLESISVERELARRASNGRKNLFVNGDFAISADEKKSKVHWGEWDGGWKGGWIGTRKQADCFSYSREAPKGCPASIRVSSPSNVTARITQYLDGERKFKPNAKYRLSVFVKLDGVTSHGKGGGVGFNIWDDKNVWFPLNRITGSSGWINQSFEFTTGPNVEKFANYVNLDFWNASGTVWFAGAWLEEGGCLP